MILFSDEKMVLCCLVMVLAILHFLLQATPKGIPILCIRKVSESILLLANGKLIEARLLHLLQYHTPVIMQDLSVVS